MAPREWTNLELRFVNQPDQRAWVSVRGVRQVYVVVVVGVEIEFGSMVVVLVIIGRRRDGTDTRAENGLRRVRERVLYDGVRRRSG